MIEWSRFKFADMSFA